jgi:plastocyanin
MGIHSEVRREDMASKVILITTLGYDPPSADVRHGDTVWWLNEDATVHYAESDDGTTFETAELRQGEAGKWVVNHALGPIPYHDRIAAFRGVLVVK